MMHGEARYLLLLLLLVEVRLRRRGAQHSALWRRDQLEDWYLHRDHDRHRLWARLGRGSARLLK